MHATRSPDLLSIPEAAERLNVSRASVYRWIEEGRLPAVQLGGRGAPIRVLADELDQWLEFRRMPSVSDDDGQPLERRQLRSGANPAERSETPKPLGQSSSPAHAGEQR